MHNQAVPLAMHTIRTQALAREQSTPRLRSHRRAGDGKADGGLPDGNRLPDGGSPTGSASGGRSAGIGVELLPRRRVGMLSASKDSPLQHLLNRYLVPLVLNRWCRALCLLLVAVGVAVSAYGATHLSEGLQISSIAPDGSFVKPFDALERELRRYAGAHVDAHRGTLFACLQASCARCDSLYL
jgi:hypothetical protein